MLTLKASVSSAILLAAVATSAGITYVATTSMSVKVSCAEEPTAAMRHFATPQPLPTTGGKQW
jgi:archaellum component FlaF (FlaF/FlaG flagellin family)